MTLLIGYQLYHLVSVWNAITVLCLNMTLCAVDSCYVMFIFHVILLTWCSGGSIDVTSTRHSGCQIIILLACFAMRSCYFIILLASYLILFLRVFSHLCLQVFIYSVRSILFRGKKTTSCIFTSARDPMGS